MRDARDPVAEDAVRSTQEASAAVEAPGALSRLLLELAQAPEEDLAASWQGTLRPGEAVGRYQIREEIGRGGFGAVYEAFDPELGRAVALKTLRPGRTRRELSADWIRKEAEAVARLDHPGIVTVFDVGTCPAGPYLVMELLRGETLQQRLEKGPLPADEALGIAEEMARALAHAHHRGVLHRDLKPANVFLTEDGRVKLLDFGLAHLLGREGGASGGTPAYMAPEQARGEPVDERTDVFAAGMVLGEMLTGRRPVDAAHQPTDGAPARESSRPGAAADAAAHTEQMWPDEVQPAAQRTVPDALAGPAPAEPRLPGVARPIARAVAAALSADPAARPRDGAAWLEALREARRAVERPRTLRRVALLAGAGLFLGVVVSAIATWRVWQRQIPTDRITVAVADFANETGEKELDSISGLLITALEQSAQFRVLTRGRMFDLLRQLGRENVERIDEPLAREVGRKGDARALLLANIRKLGDSYVVDMRALDPLTDEYLFTVSDRASGKSAVFDLVDRLGAATRRRLGAGEGEGAPAPRQVMSITTGNVKAWELYFKARQAFDQGRDRESLRLAEAALKEDPEFALAHYQIMLAGWWGAGEEFRDRNEQKDEFRVRVEAAEQRADRLPEKERIHLMAMRASVDGRRDDVTRLLDQLADAYPLDKEAIYYAGDLRFHREQVADAIPYFERVVQLDPGYALAVDHLLWTYLATGRSADHLAWIRSQAQSARAPIELRSLGRAFLAAGREEEALALFRRADAIDGRPWPPPAYVQYLALEGRAAEAEAMARAGLVAYLANAAAPDERWVNNLRFSLALAGVAQGRMADYMAPLAELDPGPKGDTIRRQWTAAIGGDLLRLRAETEELGRLGAFEDRDRGLPAALNAAEAGEAALAGAVAKRVLARGLPFFPGSDRMLGALVAWSEGSLDLAERELKAVAREPHLSVRYLGLLLLGQLARARGDCGQAVSALEEARALPWADWYLNERMGTHAIELDSLAACYEKTGDLARARERNDELLRRWARADPDLPRLAEAKARKARLEGR